MIVNGPQSVTQLSDSDSEAGIYQCTVSNARVTDGTINIITDMSNSSSLSVTG